MLSKVNVLLAGESWVTHTVHIKGMDSFTQSGYGEGTFWIRRAIERSGGRLTHLPSHIALRDFPQDIESLRQFDVVILSDIGSNTLLLHPETSVESKPTSNRLELLRKYVSEGGALVMVGGYMSFQGIHGMARYQGSPIESLLPVTMTAGADDRKEIPEGFNPINLAPEHPVMNGLPHSLPTMLFYNQVRLKPGADLLLGHEDDPILATWDYGRGRAAAFTPDIAPHGATEDFLEWDGFDRLWSQLLSWLADGARSVSEL